jgi:hypothetical protein
VEVCGGRRNPSRVPPGRAVARVLQPIFVPARGKTDSLTSFFLSVCRSCKDSSSDLNFSFSLSCCLSGLLATSGYSLVVVVNGHRWWRATSGSPISGLRWCQLVVRVNTSGIGEAEL